MDFSATDLRRLAAASKDANQSRRLLTLAAVRDGMSRTDAAKIGGMDRKTLRDWVHRFNERGSDGLKDNWRRDVPSRLSAEQRARLSTRVEIGPDRAVHGVVRWRKIDLKRAMASSTASMHKSTSMVIESLHVSTFRLNQSTTATK